MKAMQQAEGRWPSILVSYGMNESFLDGKHHPCPLCEGTDRFRWISNENGGRYVCNQCKPETGDGMDLLQKFTGKEFKDLAKEIEDNGNSYVETKPREKRDPSILIKMVTKDCVAITEGDPVSKYLKKRNLPIPRESVRLHPKCRYYENGGLKSEHPAMVSKIVNFDGMMVRFHITYLDNEGNKADVENQKKILPPKGTINGGGIYFDRPDESMVIAEGIETALAGEKLFSRKAIAALTAHGMEELKIPDFVKDVIILSDNDASFIGQKAAYTLAARLKREKRTVQVMMPADIGDDFCDVLSREIEGVK